MGERRRSREKNESSRSRNWVFYVFMLHVLLFFFSTYVVDVFFLPHITGWEYVISAYCKVLLTVRVFVPVWNIFRFLPQQKSLASRFHIFNSLRKGSERIEILLMEIRKFSEWFSSRVEKLNPAELWIICDVVTYSGNTRIQIYYSTKRKIYSAHIRRIVLWFRCKQ